MSGAIYSQESAAGVKRMAMPNDEACECGRKAYCRGNREGVAPEYLSPANRQAWRSGWAELSRHNGGQP